MTSVVPDAEAPDLPVSVKATDRHPPQPSLSDGHYVCANGAGLCVSYGSPRLAAFADAGDRAMRGGVARQCRGRTALADDQIQGSLPPGLWQCLGSTEQSEPLSDIRQSEQTALIARRTNARPSLFQPADAHPGGGIAKAESGTYIPVYPKGLGLAYR